MRKITFFNEMGDLTISWSEDRDEEMLKIIEKKMAEGIRFFMIRPRGAITPQLHEHDVRAALSTRNLAIPDEDIAKFVSSGEAVIVKTPKEPAVTTGIAKTPEEVVKGEAVAVRPLKGG